MTNEEGPIAGALFVSQHGSVADSPARTTAATAIAAAATAAAATAARTTAVFTRTGDVDDDLPAFDGRAVEGLNGLGGLLVGLHLHETETAAAARFAIRHHLSARHVANLGKDGRKAGVVGSEREVPDVKLVVLRHVLVLFLITG